MQDRLASRVINHLACRLRHFCDALGTSLGCFSILDRIFSFFHKVIRYLGLGQKAVQWRKSMLFMRICPIGNATTAIDALGGRTAAALPLPFPCQTWQPDYFEVCGLTRAKSRSKLTDNGRLCGPGAPRRLHRYGFLDLDAPAKGLKIG